MRHRWLKYSNVYINHDPVMTLTKFMARSTWVACVSELGKLLKCHLKEKANRKLANGQNIEDSEKRKWPKGLSAPALELNTIIFKHVYWYMQLISGERLPIGPLVGVKRMYTLCMVKTTQKSSSPEPVGGFPRNLVCSIGDFSPS